jgi:hypothetical protein
MAHPDLQNCDLKTHVTLAALKALSIKDVRPDLYRQDVVLGCKS